MKKNNFIFFCGLSLLSSLIIGLTRVSPAYAQEQNDDSTQSASFENIKKIIQENLANNKVKGAIDNLLNRKVALLGEVSRVTEETITITNRLGTRIIPINKELIITKDNKPVEVADIAVENWITVLGRIQDDDFSPVFIYVSNTSLQPKTQFVSIGTITEINNSSLTIVPRSGGSDKEVTVTKTTKFEDLNGAAIKHSDLSEDVTVLVSGHEIESKIEAKTVRSLVPIAESDE